MASEITNYKCPACTAPLHFGGESGMLECDYCGSQFSVDDIEIMYAEKNAQAAEAAEENAVQETVEAGRWDMDSAGEAWNGEEEQLRAYNCPSCSAELICDSTTAATSCPYCGNPTILPGKLSGSKKPDLIIPFRVSKEEAVAALKRHYQGKPLLPKAFKSENHIQEIQGVYVPFWLYDAEVEADMTFHATRVHTHTTPREVITETNHFLVHRRGNISFSRVPVDGSTKMPDSHMDAIEPFDYQELKPFALSYLPGFLANRYDVDQAACAQRANSRCAASAEAAIRQTVMGYATCIPAKKNITVHSRGVKYALLPVWMLSTRWKDKNYLFAMNGQTGKLIGDLPMNVGKLIGFICGSFVAAAGLTMLLMTLL